MEHHSSQTVLDRSLLLAGPSAGLALFGSMILFGALHPGYSHLRQYVSELGATGAPHALFMSSAGLLLSGVLTMAFALGVARVAAAVRMRTLTCVLVLIVGVGRSLAGLFPCDPGCAFPPETVSARIHNVVGVTALLCGTFAPLAFARGVKSLGPLWIHRLSILLGVIPLGLMLLGILLGPHAPFAGLLQRLVLGCFYGWATVIAVWLTGRKPVMNVGVHL
jgi:hypothetical membrane protein